MAHLWAQSPPVGTGTSARRARETGSYFYAFEFLLDPENRRGAVQKADGTWIIIEAIDIPFPAINFPRGLGRRSESAFGTIIDWTGTICTNNLHRYRWASTSATLPSWAGRGTRVIVSAAEHREIKLRRRQFYGFQPISRLSDDANAIIRQFFDHALDHEEIPGTATWQGCPSMEQLVRRYHEVQSFHELEPLVAAGWDVDYYHAYHDVVHLYREFPLMPLHARRWPLVLMRKLCADGRAAPIVDVFVRPPSRVTRRSTAADRARRAAVPAEARVVRTASVDVFRRIVCFL